MPDMREEFEAWHHAEFGYVIAEEDDPAQDGQCAERWKTWKASRAALVIEMPPRVTAEDVAEHLDIDDQEAVEIAHMVNGSIAAYATFIKQAGIEVKQ
ncbi:hypothetical protein ABZK55_001405 [Pseudomonas aeruginosa]|nr:hypothetical protein [Pseudomonas aeruginosa]EKX5105776.1 hypothetical protein [Pseudomonas aeruginosa]EMC2520326.1 hypothetical protein [Pseudomonas aeruginosa]KAB0697674.1 hypothetical protein F6X67_05425 [Pseudomonas aeruginosa]KAB0728817.1 hypothetical protein F7O90_14615 [Pseudomonas aeruginosa]